MVTRTFLESTYRDGLAEWLRREGWLVSIEVTSRGCHGRPDLVVSLPGRELRPIEVKALNPLAGIGQALGYTLGGHRGTPTLAVPDFLDTRLLRDACAHAGVDLWLMAIGPQATVAGVKRIRNARPASVDADQLAFPLSSRWA